VSPTTDPAVEPTAQPLLPDEAKTVPPPTRNTEKKTPKPRQTTTVRPSLPSGHVPDFLVGQWSGGPGGESGRYLAITADGRYERGYVSGGVESFGTVVADESTATFHDHNGSKERARLTYTDAAGIVVLSVNYAKQGYYSYVAD
jgi:hypothetical protein